MIARAMLRAERGKDMPEHLTIGTKEEFEENCALTYKKRQIGSEIIYVCSEGSAWARADEFLVLRCEQNIWTAYDSAFNVLGSTLQCRQPVYRCLDTDMTRAGWHKWQTNRAADATDDGTEPNWQGGLLAETRVP